MKLATTDQLREVDRRTKEEFHTEALLLMENAALRVVDVLQDRFKNLENKMIAVVCGKGNNGGDGLAIARHLANRLHAKVIVWLSPISIVLIPFFSA